MTDKVPCVAAIQLPPSEKKIQPPPSSEYHHHHRHRYHSQHHTASGGVETCSQCHQPNHRAAACTNSCEWPVGDEEVCGACSNHDRDHHDCVLGRQLAAKISQPRLSLLKKQLLARRQAQQQQRLEQFARSLTDEQLAAAF